MCLAWLYTVGMGRWILHVLVFVLSARTPQFHYKSSSFFHIYFFNIHDGVEGGWIFIVSD